MDGNIYLIFAVGGHRYALPAVDVERISPAAELTEGPSGLAGVRGIANVGGEAAAVADLRAPEGPPFPEMELCDRFVFFRKLGRLWGVVAEEVEGAAPLVADRVTSRDEKDGGTGVFEVAFDAPGKTGILLRTPENILSVSEDDLSLLEPFLLPAGGE
ncbi:MAG: chemotaxis protein CheW [Aminivibrio sp.]